MQKKSFSLAARDGFSLPVTLWIPDQTPRGILQIAHGMTEHIGRFASLAAALTECGIAVAGFDLRGHGTNPGEPDFVTMGPDGWQESVSDIGVLSAWIARNYPGLPHAMLGFSLGSFLLRDYLTGHRDSVCAVILMGTGNQPTALLRLLKAVVRGQIRKSGFDRPTPLVRQLSFGAYNRNFRPNRTEADWLCADSAELDGYLADPLCRPGISAGLFWQLLDSMERVGSPKACRNWDPEAPVLLLSGGDDPVGNGGKGVRAVQKQLRKAGIRHITLTLLPGARHDVLHEEASGCAAAARKCILDFLRDIDSLRKSD